MVTVYTGPFPLAQLVRDELLERGVGSDIQSVDLLGSLIGSGAGPAGMQSVLVTAEVAERQRAVIEEVLALVSQPEGEEESASEEESEGGVEPE